MDWKKYQSRKWQLTLLVIIATIALAAFDKMTGNVASVFAVVVGSYNVMQGWIDKTKLQVHP